MNAHSRPIGWMRWVARVLGTLAAACWLFVAGAALCVFAYFTAGHNKGFAVLVSGAPFLLSGLLILASLRRSRG